MEVKQHYTFEHCVNGDTIVTLVFKNEEIKNLINMLKSDTASKSTYFSLRYNSIQVNSSSYKLGKETCSYFLEKACDASNNPTKLCTENNCLRVKGLDNNG